MAMKMAQTAKVGNTKKVKFKGDMSGKSGMKKLGK